MYYKKRWKEARNNMSILALFLNFAKFGLLCFGGGYVLVPLIIQDFVETRKIFTPEEFGNLLSISQVTPGPIGINAATYVGYIQNGFFGSLVATFSLIFPALILTPLAIISLNKWQDKFVVQGILKGTRISALSLVLYAVIIFLGMSVFTAPIPWDCFIDCLRLKHTVMPDDFAFSVKGSLIFALAMFISLKTKLSTIYLIILSAIVGALLSFI